MLYNELHQGGIRALLDYDDTLFDDLVLPDDLNTNDIKQMVVNDIVFRHGDQPLFCPDPTVMKFYIKEWSMRMSPLWDRFYKVMTAEYDPLENYNRIEDTTVELTLGHTITTDDDLTNGLTQETQVSAYNENSYQPDSKTINSGKDQRDITEKHTGKDTNDIDGHIHGNIGVTTSQQMLESELTLIPKLDAIRYISDSFQAEFCLAVY